MGRSSSPIGITDPLCAAMAKAAIFTPEGSADSARLVASAMAVVNAVGSCSAVPGSGLTVGIASEWPTANTSPSEPVTTALTDVVPTSSPTTTSVVISGGSSSA